MGRGRLGGPSDIVHAHETLSELIARGYTEDEATEMIAFGVFARRTESGIEPAQADHDYARGAGPLAARRYLEQVAPEELER